MEAPQVGLSSPIQHVKGIGPRLAALFEKKGICTVEDALYFLPRAYEDRRALRKIGDLQAGLRQTAAGEVLLSGSVSYRKGKKGVFEAVVGDGTGAVTLKWFHGQERYLKDRFKKGTRLLFSGDVRWFNRQKEIHHPDVDMLDDDPEKDLLSFGRIVPIYSESDGLHQKTLRRLMKHIVDAYADLLFSPVPPAVRDRQKLMDIREAFRTVHFPPEGESPEALNLHRSEAHRTIIFDEFFYLELGLALKKKRSAEDPGISFQPEGRLATQWLSRLSFDLTRAQQRVFSDIKDDMASPRPMNRLIQGDVGCGKTAVALLACLNAIECGYQAALMVPTEILAEQHYFSFRQWLDSMGIGVALMTGTLRGPEREDLYERVRAGAVPLVIGTHALIQEDFAFQKLGLVVVDEQHKFGVVQRGLLRKKGRSPDILVMTATPIPRTLAMTVYGDLDVSVIDEMPRGRMPVETRVFRESSRERVYGMMEQEVKKGRQAFIVYPLVEESESLDLKDATRMGEHLQKDVFPDLRVALLHGRMKREEKEAIMSDFRDRKTDILVATTVVEVGIDVPNASVMVIEHAERFGLSQLHQLRGRIGRGQHPSKCVLLAQYALSDQARARLRTMEKTSDGFQVAEEDLALRGPGEFFGTRQSGFPDLRVAHLVRDTPVLAEARKEAFRLVELDPDLTETSHRGLREVLTRRWAGRLEMATIG
jgi:ATP-dependent DNA helicase RecG